MTANRTLDLSHLQPYDISSEAPLWWGQLFMAIVECTMFAILIAMYFYIRLSMDMWPPPGILIPELVLPSVCVVLLILSCIGSYLASEAAKRGDREGMIRGLVLNLALALAGMVARGINWGQWNFRWDVDAYGSIVWCIIFLHTFDIVADLLFTGVLVAILVSRGARSRFQAATLGPTYCNSFCCMSRCPTSAMLVLFQSSWFGLLLR